MRGALPLLAAMVALPATASAQDSSFAPFSFAEVGFEPECTPNAALQRLITVLHGRAGGPSANEDGVLDAPLYDAVSGATWQRLLLDGAADWHGLQFKGIELHLGIERGPANYTLLFVDAPETVREVWNARGWKLPPPGQPRDIEGLEGYASIMVGPELGGGASVTCFRD